MAHVNLLPWREMAEQRAKKRFGIQAGVAVVIALIAVSLSYVVVDNLKQAQQTRNKYLQDQITIMDGKIAEIQRINQKKAEILNRMKLIQSLHQDRNTAIRILNELAERTPSGVALENVEKRDDMLVIGGSTVSNQAVAEFLRALRASPLFENPELRQVVADKAAERNERNSKFVLSVTLVEVVEEANP
ncbi:PilN domain-containing protein [Pseudidiomarina taiwanensis]|uniref:Pilus assembly protein PilN n=1 Tax=Pseudidiomarina taiwanensis TaxID=337250 RepID=A0A432ZH97_9GAMM|nr:PilN domain-containing protein [Pseudidiomarina taiwanensis]RUO76662.1 pilus assembly protein PilN [Pseudidiomarina taiwanensis]